MGLHSFFRKIDDQVRGVASDADDWRRDNPALAAMIPFTPENQALMAGGGALLSGGMALSGALGAGGAAGTGGAAGAGAAAGSGMSLGSIGSVLGSIGASLYGANQAKKGVNAQIEAGDRAAALEAQSAADQLKLQREIWEKQQKDQAPYLKQGQQAIGKLSDLTLGGDGFKNYISSQGINSGAGGYNDFLRSRGLANGQFNTNNPQYQFLQKQGMQALDRSAAARGMGYSGVQLKALNEYGQGLASQQYDKEYARAANEYNDIYNRAAQEYGNYFNRLASLSQGGQQAAQSLGGLGSNYSSNAANTFANLSNAQTSILGQQANARASGYAAQANAFNQGLGNMIDIYGISKKYG